MGCAASSVDSEAPRVLDMRAFHERFTLGEQLGQGSYGTVRAVRGLGGDGMVVKIIDFARKDAESALQDVSRARSEARKEAGLWKSLGQHPNVVGFHSIYLTSVAESGCAYLVMERCGMDLRVMLQSMRKVKDQGGSKARLAALVRCMLAALDHLHGRGIVHCDVKPENFLSSCHNAAELKLCDFGLAVALPACGFLPRSTGGTVPYMAPEVLREKPCDTKIDAWACGVCCYELLYGCHPFQPSAGRSDDAAFRSAIRFGPLPSYRTAAAWPASLPKARELVEGLLRKDALTRVSATVALQADLLAGTIAPDELGESLGSLPSNPGEGDIYSIEIA